MASVTSGGQRYGYTYDSMGNIATFSAPGKGTVTYTYDNQGQLLKAAGDTTYTYTYDGAGNLLTASDGTVTHSYTYGDATWKDLLTAFDGNSISYDAIGNPTSYLQRHPLELYLGQRSKSGHRLRWDQQPELRL